MKSFQVTLIWGALVLAVAGFALYDFLGQERRQTRSQAQRALLPIDVNEVQAFEQDFGNEKWVIQKRDGQWRVISPIQDLLDSSAVETHLRSIFSQEVSDITSEALSEKEAVDWSIYGLDQPTLKLSFFVDQDQTSPKVVVEVGSEQAFDESYYLRRGDDLLLADSGWSGVTSKALSALREKRLWRNPKPIHSFHIERRGQKVTELIRDPIGESHSSEGSRDRVWSYVNPPGFRPSSAKVESFLQNFGRIRVSEFVAEDRDKTTLKQYELQPPQWKVTFYTEQNEAESEAWSMEFSQESGESYLVAPGGETFIARVRSRHIQPLLKEDKDFRDKSEPFDFDLLLASELRVNAHSHNFQLVKLGVDWEVEGDSGLTVARNDLVEFFESLQFLRVQEFLSGSQVPEGLEQEPENRIKILSLDDQIIFDVQWSKKHQPRGLDTDHYYVKSVLSPDWMRVEARFFDDLPIESLVTE